MSTETMIPNNITDLKRKYYKLAKEMYIFMNMCGDNRIEIYEKDKSKGYEFAKEVHKLNGKCKVVDIIGSGSDVDVKGNSMEGTTALYLVDDDYYNRLIAEDDEQLIIDKGDGLIE